MKLKAKLRKALSGRSRSSIISTVPDADAFLYSEPLENVHHPPPRAFTTIPSRLHKQDAQAVESAKLFGAEMMSAMSQRRSDLPCVGSCIGHMSSLLYPECLPERLDTVAMILEGATIHDDIVERDDLESAMDHHHIFTSFLGTPQGVDKVKSAGGLRWKEFMSKVVVGFTAKYGAEGKVLLERCMEYWIRPMEFVVKTDPTSFEDSVSHRIVNMGTRAISALLEFSLGIRLSDDEMKQINHIVNVADRILANTNDYFSWEVERDNGNRVQNSIKVLMEMEGRSEEQAKEKLKIAILEDEKIYQLLSKQFFQSSPYAPARVQRFIAMLEVLLGGHHNWCAASERYKVRTSSDEKEIKIYTVEDKSENVDPLCSSFTTLGDSALLDPVHYIKTLPSKNMRSKVIDALNTWFRLPDNHLDTVKSVVDDVHNSTLLLDDIQDASCLRRGFATAHNIFGPGQCINSATYMVAQAASRLVLHQDEHPQLIQIFLDGLKELAVGQSWDLNWKITGHCPSTAEYMAMVDGKTGAMFGMIIRMMQGFSTVANWPIPELNQLAKLLGRWYQVRDDYQNLQDEQYTSQKGFCEDLDEGKLSYPLTVCCDLDPVAQRIIMGIFRQRQSGTPLALNVKIQILDIFRHTGALQQTWEVIEKLEKSAEAALSNLEAITGEPNPKFRAILSLLGSIPRPSQDCE